MIVEAAAGRRPAEHLRAPARRRESRPAVAQRAAFDAQAPIRIGRLERRSAIGAPGLPSRSPEYDRTVTIDFTFRDLPGWVQVTIGSNDDPEALGMPATATGFPVCTATVTYRGQGPRAALGWIQLVRSSDNASGGAAFELDPFYPLGVSAHPFCFFGFAPTLFDAPWRDPGARLAWTAHSFLAFIAEDGRRAAASALVGFSWGFSVADSTCTHEAPTVLAASAWDGHRGLLAAAHPTWGFTDGYRSH